MTYIVPLILAWSFTARSTLAPVNINWAGGGTISFSPSFQLQDNELSTVRRLDREGRTPGGPLPQLMPQEHMRRAGVYLTNRAFAEAREHFRAVIERYPNDANVPAALFGMGRYYFQVRDY